MRDFSQGLYTFSLRLELYLPGRAPNRVGPQRGRVANLGRKSWSRGHVIANTGQPGFSRQYWSSWPLSSILVANLGIEVHDECSTESSYLLTGSVPLQYPPSTPEVSEISYFTSWFLAWFWPWSKSSSCSCSYVVHGQQCFVLFLPSWIVCSWFVSWIVYQGAIVDSLLLSIQPGQAAKDGLHGILLPKLVRLSLSSCTVPMFFVRILPI